MSSIPQKKQPLIGYVHDVSELKRNRQDSFDYHNFTIQTSSSESKEALLYSPKKKKLLLDSQESRTPVKLHDYTFTNDQKKIVVNDMTYITTVQLTEYSFQYKELPVARQEPVTLLNILNEKKEWEVITVNAKLLSTKEPTTVCAKKLRLCEGVIADATATMPIDIWEHFIDKLKPGNTYSFKSLQIRVWSNRKKLSTTKKSDIDEMTDDTLAAILVEDDATYELATAEIKVDEFLKIEKFEVFLKCSRKIPQNTTSRTVRCNRCGVMRADKCLSGLTTKVSLKSSNENLSLKFGDELLSQLLHDEEVLSMDEETLADKLLYLQNITLTYETSTLKVIDVSLETPV